MIRPISPQDLARLIEAGGRDEELPDGRVRLFDVRDQGMFEQGHVPLARHVPPSQALRWIPQWVEPYELVVVIDDDGGRGGSARHVTAELAHQWFRRLRFLDGGMSAWRSANLPVEQGGPSGIAAASSCGTSEDFHRSKAVPWKTSRRALPPDPERVRYGDTSGS
jgi:rhodanese-related sulfurtransferase